MKKIALHTDGNDRVVLLEYKDVDESKKNSFLRGTECYEYIRKLAKNKIIDIYENPNGKDIVLEYDKYIIELKDYSNLLRKRGLAPILDSIRIYEEKQQLKSHKRKNVTRKNKYTKVRIMAGGLSILILTGCVMGMFHKSNKKDEKVMVSITDNLEEDYIDDLKYEVILEPSMELNTKNDIEEEKIVPTVSINYDDRSDTTKAHKTKAYYSELISKYSKIYGLDSNLVTAIATQESGIHSGIQNEGGATGLMQVQNEVWVGKKLSAYNFETKCVETIIVEEESLSYVDYSVKVGCMILQTVLKYMDYNILAAVQCYNMGYGNMQKILNAYSVDCGKSVDEILNDVTDVNWMNYRYLIEKGDQEYVENVFSWLGNDIEINNKKDDGSEVCFNINSLEQTKIIR